ncbi:MAG: M1 family aminopeptidase [Patulibacter minatonensis]
MRLRPTLRLIVAAAALLTGAIGPSAHAAGTVLPPLDDAVSYTADLTASPDGRTFTGTERIVVRNAGSGDLARVWLRLWGNGPQGCKPLAVSASVTSGGRVGRTSRNCSALEVVLSAPLPPDRLATIDLAVSITAPDLSDRFGAADDVDLFGNALPVVAQRDRRAWRLPNYSPYGESWVTTWAHFELTLRHPAALKVAASGTTVTTPDSSGQSAVTTSVIDARDTFWAIGKMDEVQRRTKRGVLVRAWSPTDAAADREDAVRDATTALDQIELRLPKYPYEEYDVIVARIEAGGGMEYPGAVITDGSSDVTRHETGHQWFYGLVGDDQYREPWVDEGLTTFLELYWTSPTSQQVPTCYLARRFRVPDPSTFITSSMSYWNKHVGQYGLAYDQPACALADLRSKLGNAKFSKIMRGIVTDYGTKIVTGAEVRRAFGRQYRGTWPRWGLGPGR